MDCAETQKYLRDLTLREILPPGIKEEVQTHLTSCPRCRKEAEELSRAWHNLDWLEEARFSRRLSKKILRELARERKSLWLARLGEVISPRRVYLRVGALILIAAVGLTLGVRFFVRPRGTIGVDQSASVFRYSPRRLPDIKVTLGNYLEHSAEILAGLESNRYPSWKGLIKSILESDIQGQANFLLENLKSDSAARPLVHDLHDTFWLLLQTGRSRAQGKIELPSEMNVSLLIKEIEEYREKTVEKKD